MKKYVIFGCGYHGRLVYRKLKQQKKSILIWVDNDKKKLSKNLFGIKIKSVASLKYTVFDKIIFSGRFIQEQLSQYKKLKLNNKKIIIWDAFKLKPSKKQQDKREKNAKKILKEILSILSKKKIIYWVDLSGLLQIIRDKKISILSDFDLSFYYRDHFRVIKLFKRNKKYKIVKKKIRKKYYKIFITGKNNNKFFEAPIFDFHFKINEGYLTRDVDGVTQNVPSKFLKSFIDYQYNRDLKLIVPKNYIKYLQHLYGKRSWKKRIPFFKETLLKKNKLFFSPLDEQ